MGQQFIISLIPSLLSLVGVIFTSWKSYQKTIAENIAANQRLIDKLEQQSREADVQIQAKFENYRSITEAKIEELRKEVAKHNSIVERTYKLEELTAVQSEQIKSANHRIADLEHAHS